MPGLPALGWIGFGLAAFAAAGITMLGLLIVIVEWIDWREERRTRARKHHQGRVYDHVAMEAILDTDPGFELDREWCAGMDISLPTAFQV